MTLELKNKKVGLLGFGVENQGLLPYLLAAGAQVTICDKNEFLPRKSAEVAYRLGADYLKNLTDFDIVFRTPGLPYLSQEIQLAKKAGVVVTSQIELFMNKCKGRLIGVTGTKGKSTTATLIFDILKQAKNKGEIKENIFLAGNIGVSAMSLLEEIRQNDWVILELSSFQLQGLEISPRLAVVLGIAVDHLDYHKNEEEYVAAKKSIVCYQNQKDYAVINADSKISLSFAQETKGRVLTFSRLSQVSGGAFVSERGEILLRLPSKPEQAVCLVKDIKLLGCHNLENVLAATVAAALVGASSDSIKTAIVQFRGLPHRLQFVAEKQGILYFDDSKATTPDATIAAIRSFSQPLTLIIGGSSKKADYSELVEAIVKSSVENVICIGQEGERLQRLLEARQAPQKIIRGGATISEIVQQAVLVSRPGSAVLLSPAAASFGMFKNAEDRGEQFQQCVRDL